LAWFRPPGRDNGDADPPGRPYTPARPTLGERVMSTDSVPLLPGDEAARSACLLADGPQIGAPIATAPDTFWNAR